MRFLWAFLPFILDICSAKQFSSSVNGANIASPTSLLLHRKAPARAPSTAEVIANLQLTAEAVLKPSTARALLVSCAALYGSNYSLTKLLQDALNPAFVTTFRFLIASAVFLPSTIRGLKGGSALALGSVELGIWCSIGFISQAMILTKTSASKAAFFCGLSVLMPPIFEVVEKLICSVRSGSGVTATKEPAVKPVIYKSLLHKVSKIPFIQPLLALCGVAVLEWGSGMEPAGLSDLALLITPISFSMCFWRSAQLGVKFPSEISSITGIMLSTTAILGVAWSSVSLNFCCSAAGGSDFPAECKKLFTALSGWKVIAGLVYSGVLTTAFTSFVEQQVIRVLTAAETTLIYSLEPLFATAFAAIILKEQVTGGTMLGATFIILACLWDTIIDYIAGTV